MLEERRIGQLDFNMSAPFVLGGDLSTPEMSGIGLLPSQFIIHVHSVEPIMQVYGRGWERQVSAEQVFWRAWPALEIGRPLQGMTSTFLHGLPDHLSKIQSALYISCSSGDKLRKVFFVLIWRNRLVGLKLCVIRTHALLVDRNTSPHSPSLLVVYVVKILVSF